MVNEIERVLAAVIRLKALLEDPQPGPFSWQEAVDRLRREITPDAQARG